MVDGARQSVQFFKQNALIIESNRAFPIFLYEVFHYLICLIKL